VSSRVGYGGANRKSHSMRMPSAVVVSAAAFVAMLEGGCRAEVPVSTVVEVCPCTRDSAAAVVRLTESEAVPEPHLERLLYNSTPIARQKAGLPSSPDRREDAQPPRQRGRALPPALPPCFRCANREYCADWYGRFAPGPAASLVEGRQPTP